MIKRLILILCVISLPVIASAQMYKPYILGVKTEKQIIEVKESVISALKSHQLNVVGQYMPANDKNRWVMVVTHPDLLGAAELEGGIRGFAATLRVGITRENNVTIISYTSPEYWGRAYYQDSFDKVSKHYERVEIAFKNAMSKLGNFDGSGFGSEKGLDEKDLMKYHYMIGMPYFDDTEELAVYQKQNEALKVIDNNIKTGVPNVTEVYKVDIPNSNMRLYGFALGGPEGEAHFLPIIDIEAPLHTAALPYELLVVDGEIHMLKGRYRIAIAFPDLTMGTFTKIMSTPGDIEDLLKQLVE